MKENRNEIINRSGICSNAKLVVEVENLRFVDYNPGMKSIFVKVKLGTAVQKTMIKNNSNPVYGETFEL
jgi:hypothetical protein